MLANEQLEIVQRLIVAAKYKDNDTMQHVVRVGRYAHALYHQLGAPCERCGMMYYAAQLHDIGKIGIPDQILGKPGSLTQMEFAIVKQHSEIGAQILGGSQSKVLQMAESVALSHHECWDGSGYPFGLSGKDIPLEARVVQLADVYDALRTERPYKAAFNHDQAVSIILEGDGRTNPGQFDPALLEILRGNNQVLAEIFGSIGEVTLPIPEATCLYIQAEKPGFGAYRQQGS